VKQNLVSSAKQFFKSTAAMAAISLMTIVGLSATAPVAHAEEEQSADVSSAAKFVAGVSINNEDSGTLLAEYIPIRVNGQLKYFLGDSASGIVEFDGLAPGTYEIEMGDIEGGYWLDNATSFTLVITDENQVVTYYYGYNFDPYRGW
jgi:hypothetical protein